MPRRPSIERAAINKRLMQVIREKGLRQADCVRATGATSPTVNDWFNKGAVPDASTLGLLARATGTNCHWLITGDGPRHAPGQGETRADKAIQMGREEALSMVSDALAQVKRDLDVK